MDPQTILAWMEVVAAAILIAFGTIGMWLLALFLVAVLRGSR